MSKCVSAMLRGKIRYGQGLIAISRFHKREQNVRDSIQ